jgi:hypothetical protein
MARRFVILACVFLVPFGALGAQASAMPRIRFVVVRDGASGELVGRLQSVTADSIGVRFANVDTVVFFARRSVTRLERERRRLGPGRGALLGCVSGGVLLGVYGYSTTHDPDSPGIERVAGVLGGAVGCGAGALIGLFLGSRSPQWEPFTLDGE